MKIKGNEGAIICFVGAILALFAAMVGIGWFDGSALIAIDPKPIAIAAVVLLLLGLAASATKWNLK